MTTLWLILLPLAGAVVVTALRRWSIIVVPLTAAILLAMTFLAANVIQTEYTYLLGRLVALRQTVAILLAFCYALTTAVVLASYRITHTMMDYPIVLLFMALVTATATIEDNTLGAMFFSAASIVLVLVLASTVKNKTSIQVLSVLVLVGPLLLITVWALESRALDPNDISYIRLGATGLALVIALGLGILPLGLWLLPVFRNGNPLAILFSYILQLALYIRLGSIISLNLWPEAQATLAGLVVIAGLVTAIGGGVLAAFQTNLGGVFAYTVIADMGIVLISSSLGSNLTLQTGLLHLAFRGLGLTGLAVGMGVIYSSRGASTFESMKGVWRLHPMAVSGILLSALSLVGFPFTAGFATRFGILSAMGTYRLGWAIALVASGFGPAFAWGRFALATRGEAAEGRDFSLTTPSAISLCFGLVLIILGIYPNLLSVVAPEIIKTLSGITLSFFQ